jgi:uncharacterized protein YdeI (YjbR/CyaY-like superfamily)
MEAVYFSDQHEFRQWLSENHQRKTELLVGFYKVGTGIPSMTWSESVDQALCFGWIDGITKSVDKERYTIRFTPRKPTSIWSNINIEKVKVLTSRGLMQPAGFASFAKRQESKSGIYAFEQDPVDLSEEFEKLFKANKEAWAHFKSMAPSYQKTAIHSVMTAKQEKTRKSRLESLIKDSEEASKLKQLKQKK